MTNPLICEHGQLRRQCQHCDDAREILELRDENCQLRQILCNVLTACGNGSGATPQASLEFFATVPDEVAAVVMKMGNEVAALRPDAMRYQWLRSNCECMGWGSRSDAAIDAAMGAAGVPVAEYLAKVEADPRRAAALQRARERAARGVATDGALSPHAAALDVETVLERLDFIAGHEASAILRDTAEAAAAMIRAARGVAPTEQEQTK